ncbi:MAG: hypothetical protein P1U47_00330 [Zhongshania sp.]|uniref:hypothetical protein n=1 Tax=Zhongshania sp. TaxID=1971902 RepID=UPI002636C85E|nr:hypothetical protein [Zhongshania sp.]MDF1690788.1 hypothetical protein [Zhongshania sp.]
MKIKSLVVSTLLAVSGLYAGAATAQIGGLPVVGILSGGLGGGGIPVLGSLSGGGIPVLGSLDGGIPVLGSLGGGGIPVLGSLDGLPLMGNLDGVVPELPGLDGIIDVAAVPNIVPGLLADLPRSLGRNAGGVSGVVGLVTQLNPLQSFGTVAGIGGNLGVGALYSLVPVIDVVVNDPSNIVEYLLGNGTILTQFGILGDLPDIPLVTAPLGLGYAEGIPVLGGL